MWEIFKNLLIKSILVWNPETVVFLIGSVEVLWEHTHSAPAFSSCSPVTTLPRTPFPLATLAFFYLLWLAVLPLTRQPWPLQSLAGTLTFSSQVSLPLESLPWSLWLGQGFVICFLATKSLILSFSSSCIFSGFFVIICLIAVISYSKISKKADNVITESSMHRRVAGTLKGSNMNLI